MKPILPALAIAASLLATCATAGEAVDVADSGTVQEFVQSAYPRITNLTPMQPPETFETRVRWFASDEAFQTYRSALNSDGTADFVYGKGGMVMDDIISKVSVYDRKFGDWKAEFVARHKKFGGDTETVECFSVTVMLSALPVAAGTNAVGIVSIEKKPSKVTCPQG